MSAYMPAKQPISIVGISLGRFQARTVTWITVTAILLAAGATLSLFLSSIKPAALVRLSSGPSGSISDNGVSAQFDHGFVIVRGEALNQADAPKRNVLAVVELFGSNGELREVESALVQSYELAPHSESPFLVRMPDPGDVKSYRIRFRPLDLDARQ
jgi:hypothetical protein